MRCKRHGPPPPSRSRRNAVGDPAGILAQLAPLVAERAKAAPSRITSDTDLRDGLGIDSLDMIDLVTAAEDRFGVRIPDDDAERFRTVGDVVAFLHRAKPGS